MSFPITDDALTALGQQAVADSAGALIVSSPNAT